MLYLLAIKFWTQQCRKFAEDKCSQVKAWFQTFGLKLAALSLYACQKMWGKNSKLLITINLVSAASFWKQKKKRKKKHKKKTHLQSKNNTSLPALKKNFVAGIYY